MGNICGAPRAQNGQDDLASGLDKRNKAGKVNKGKNKQAIDGQNQPQAKMSFENNKN